MKECKKCFHFHLCPIKPIGINDICDSYIDKNVLERMKITIENQRTELDLMNHRIKKYKKEIERLKTYENIFNEVCGGYEKYLEMLIERLAKSILGESKEGEQNENN